MSSQYKQPPKLLMEINRNDEIPRLVSIHDNGFDQNRMKHRFHNKDKITLHQQLENQCNLKDQLIHKLKLELQTMRGENGQLNLMIKQLTNKIDKLKEVNDHLIERIKEVQNSYRNLRTDLDIQNQQEMRRLKKIIYKDIEEYLKKSIFNFTEQLKTQKMTPKLQNKVELFLQSIMQINSISVETLGRKQRIDKLRLENNELARSIEQIIEKQSRTISKHSPDNSNSYSPGPNRSQYATIINRLTAGADRYQSDLPLSHYQENATVIPRNTSQSRSPLRGYATTPPKRRKIFD